MRECVSLRFQEGLRRTKCLRCTGDATCEQNPCCYRHGHTLAVRIGPLTVETFTPSDARPWRPLLAPYPAGFLWYVCSFLPKRPRPHLTVYRCGTTDDLRNATSTAEGFRGCGP